MKRLMLLLLVICLALPFSALGEEAAYEAISTIEFHIRREKESGDWLEKVPHNTYVAVLEYGPEWCCVAYKGVTGWARTRWLHSFRSLDARKYPVPNAPQMLGAVRLTQPTWVVGDTFKGLTAAAGAILCVADQSEETFLLPVWRGQGTIPADSGELLPFVSWHSAQAGALLGGFTTYYNERTGGSLAKERAYNIALACQRMDGVVLAPGEQFSFNALCAPYKKSNGYQKAPNISKDGVGYGGGVCQVTTTLYNALLGLPLQIDDWAIHRESGVQYIPQYFDAAVGSYSDLQFTNTLPYALRLTALPQEGAVTVLLYRGAD